MSPFFDIAQVSGEDDLLRASGPTTRSFLVVVADMPVVTLGNVFRSLRSIAPDARIVSIGAEADPHSGADYHVSLDADVSDLLQLSGLAPSRESLSESVLSPRQVEVLEVVAHGNSNQETARLLSISDATVKRHLADAYLRLDARSRIEAIRKATRLGYLSPPAVGMPIV